MPVGNWRVVSPWSALNEASPSAVPEVDSIDGRVVRGFRYFVVCVMFSMAPSRAGRLLSGAGVDGTE